MKIIIIIIIIITIIIIMIIKIIIIINMDDIRQERPNEGLILKLNTRLKLNKKFRTNIRKSMAF